MTRTITRLFITVCLITLCGATKASSQLLENFNLAEPAFSPDGDGSQDTTSVSFRLAEASPELSIVVYESDSVSVVDTLIAPSGAAEGTGRVGWDGTDFTGNPVPDGLYIVKLTATGNTEPDTVATLPVAVDRVSPSITILGAEPGIYAPGLLGTPQVYTATVLVSGASPTYDLPHLADELLIEFKLPSGLKADAESLRVDPPFEGASGMYALKWRADSKQAKDGIYTIDMYISDQAGHSAATTQYANVDITPPTVESTNIENDATYTVAPDTMYAWAWDRNGIDSVYVKLSNASDFVHVEPNSVVNDTAFFVVRLTEALADEGRYGITLRVKDAVAADTGRVTRTTIQVNVDRTAPSAPTLTPFNGVSQKSVYRLTGSWTGSPVIVRIYNNGSLVDSVYTLVSESLSKDVSLVPGENVFTATSVDDARNESEHSNEVVVRFDDAAGLFIPAPFVPGEEFVLNLGREAREAKLRVYDLSGELVVTIERPGPEKNYALSWDGVNGSGDNVKKGPLVAVAEVFYQDGTVDVLREIFLFDPGG